MKKVETSTFGVKVIFVFVFIGALVIVSRLFFIQVVEGDNYSERASSQYTRPINQLFNRGNIYMKPREGETFPVATVNETYVLYINPQVISEPELAYAKVNEITPVDRDIFMERATLVNDPYEILKRGLSESVKEKINKLNFIGISTHPERERLYTADTLASQVIGFMSYDGNDLVGTYGIEREFQTLLADKTSERHVNIFAEILLGKDTEEIIEKSGVSDIVLTLEPSVQIFVEQELENLLAKYEASRAGAIVMNPNTGKIISMATTPGFDPNNFNKADPTNFSNPNISNVYEMGSIMKILTMAAGLDSGAITAQSIFRDEGYIEADRARITNVYKGARGDTSMQGILSHSMNTGVSWIVSQMGNKEFADYFRSFGLDEKTGVALPNEASGLMDNLDSPRTLEYYTASFGQGIATTPIATIRAIAAVANGGLLVNPYIVSEIQHAEGTIEKHAGADRKRVLSEKASLEVSRMLVDLVDNTLEVVVDGEQSIPTHTVAAKTGTAQMSNALTGEYSDDDFFHSFVGYFPAYDPEFIILLWVERPKDTTYASQTLTSPFFRITNFLIDHYAINPDR